jgi:hypothetical protein
MRCLQGLYGWLYIFRPEHLPRRATYPAGGVT